MVNLYFYVKVLKCIKKTWTRFFGLLSVLTIVFIYLAHVENEKQLASSEYKDPKSKQKSLWA